MMQIDMDKNLLDLLRSQYEVLHTQDLNESVSFVEDVLARGFI